MSELLTERSLTASEKAVLEAEYFRYNRITELEAEVLRSAVNKKMQREKKLQEGRNLITHFQRVV